MLIHRKTPKGFTIAELLIVIAFIAFLSIVAITQSIGAQREFAFLNVFNGAIEQVRSPRLYAVTNLLVPDEYNAVPEYLPPRYGIHITREEVTVSGEIISDDYIFSSPSAAAAIVLGRNANGLTEWKLKDGKTLKEFESSDKTTEV